MDFIIQLLYFSSLVLLMHFLHFYMRKAVIAQTNMCPLCI